MLMDENVREVELFCKTASSLHTSRETRALANATARALDNLKQRYDLLSQVEEGVWSGMSADASTVASLVQLDLDVQHNTAGAAVQIALAVRPEGSEVTFALTGRPGVPFYARWSRSSFQTHGCRPSL